MSYVELWNEIVSEYDDNLKRHEDIVQKTWEMLFKLCFKYSKSEIDPQRPVQMGSTPKYPDIIIKNDNEDLFIVELKRHALHEGQEQLFSYLNQLKVDLGVLVCDNLYVYDYDFTAKTDAYSVLEIPFAKDDSNGARFVELFSKENFDKQKIKDFINEGNAKKQAESDVRNELSSELAVRLLKNYFAKKYQTIEKVQIEKILAEYNVSVEKKIYASSTNEDSDKKLNAGDTDKLSKDDIYKICNEHGIALDTSNLTLAGRNGNDYPANVNFKKLQKDWWIALDDRQSRNLHILKVPAYSIKKEDVIVRSDKKNCFLFYVRYDSPCFLEHRSGIEFKRWHIKTIHY